MVSLQRVLFICFFLCPGILLSQFLFCNSYNPYGFYSGVVLSWEELNNLLRARWSEVSNCDERSEYRVFFTYTDGGLRLPFEPEKASRNVVFFSGKKKLDERSYFSGFFAYRRDFLWRKKWVHDRNPYVGNPFLLADSSTGDFELNGIICNFRYMRELERVPVVVGMAVLYGVDEEMKKIFPRPRMSHRDILTNVGVEYRFPGGFLASLQFMYFDFQEISLTTRYSLEQNRTPVFFKVRGMDNPLVFRGQTSEERLKGLNGKFVELSLNTGLLSVMGSGEKASAKIVDGGAYPVDQGRWSSVRYVTQGILFFKRRENVSGSLYFCYHGNSQEALHPDLKMITYRLKRECFTVGVNFKPKLGGSSSLFELGGRFSKLKKTDVFNGILHYYSYLVPFGKFRVEGFRIGKIRVFCGGGISKSFLRRSVAFTEREDWFYSQVSLLEHEYFSRDFVMHSLTLGGCWGLYKLMVDLSQWVAGGQSRAMVQITFSRVR